MQAALPSLECWIESHMFGTHISKILYFLCPLSLLRLLFICKVDIRAPTTCTQWRRVCRAVAVCSSTGGMICHNQCRVFNIQIKMSLSHPSRPSWQKPSHACQEYRVQLRTNFKMNLKSICHQIFMPLPDYLWHFNYKHPRRGVLQILTLCSYNKLYWQPLSGCSTHLE